MPRETPKPAANRRSLGRKLRQAVAIASALALLFEIAVWGVLRLGDDWWPATILLFLPRWIWALPPGLLVLLCAVWRRRSLAISGSALVLALGPVMGLCVPWRPWLDPPPTECKLRVLTCNMHYGKPDPNLLESLLRDARPDVVALQEWRDSAKSVELAKNHWHTHRVNGLFLASRYPILLAVQLGTESSGPKGSAMRYELLTPAGLVTLISLHLESPRDGLDRVAGKGWSGQEHVIANSARRRQQSEFLAGVAARVSGRLLLVGDFNTPPESVFFRRIWGEYRDAFSDAGFGWGNTFVTVRTRVRIDHILLDESARACQCWVGPDVGSPHRPVIADISWPDRLVGP